MSSIATLTIGAPRAEASLALVGRNNVPVLWSNGFVASELRRETTEDDEPRFVFEATAGALRDRFAAIARHLDADASEMSEYVREAWAGCAILAQALAEIPPAAPAVLDANEVAAMSDEGATETALLQQIASFEALRAGWNAELARNLARAMRDDALTGALAVDRLRARRATGTESDREGFFALLFGGATGPGAATIERWQKAAPRAAPLKPLDEEARLLLETLVARGLVTVSEKGRAGALRFLEIAARHRTARALQEILEVLFAQRSFAIGKVAPKGWRDFDRIVALNQDGEVPVFDAELLAAVVGVLGD